MCGIDQTSTYCDTINQPLNLQFSSSLSTFGDNDDESKGRSNVQVPIDFDGSAEFKVNVVVANNPLFLNLKDLEYNGILLNHLDDLVEY